jgi:hypothetical protein
VVRAMDLTPRSLVLILGVAVAIMAVALVILAVGIVRP